MPEIQAPTNARERSRIETRRRLLEQGAELFARQGVTDTRAVDIAQAAGVAVGTLYLHYKDKNGLLRAILFSRVEELLTPLRALAERFPEDVTEAVRTHSEIMVRFVEENNQFSRIFFDPEAEHTDISTEIIEYLVSMQEERLREGLAKGFFPADLDPVVSAQAIVGMIVHVLRWWTRHPDQASRETIIETLTRLRVSGLYLIEE